MLKPLEQFICDKCKMIIENPSEGYVEYLSVNTKSYEELSQTRSQFKIVHHNGRVNCSFHDRTIEKQTLPLSDFTGENRLNVIFSFLDEGYILSPEKSKVNVEDRREFINFARRLTVPYFEEARLYFDQAISEGYFDGENEFFLFSKNKLKMIVEEFSQYEKERF